MTCVHTTLHGVSIFPRPVLLSMNYHLAGDRTTYDEQCCTFFFDVLHLWYFVLVIFRVKSAHLSTRHSGRVERGQYRLRVGGDVRGGGVGRGGSSFGYKDDPRSGGCRGWVTFVLPLGFLLAHTITTPLSFAGGCLKRSRKANRARWGKTPDVGPCG